MEDLFVEVDKSNKKIGLRPIKDFQTGKFIHRSSHLLLFNSKNEVLMCKRSANKRWYPNLYTYSASGTVKDESCVKEEMKEELGINIKAKLAFIYPYLDKYDKSFHAFFIGKTDKKIKPEKLEISSLRWLSLKELEKDISENPKNYVPHVVFGLKRYFNEVLAK
jgi:isopentenyl-diphosphate Delta-isomerase